MCQCVLNETSASLPLSHYYITLNIVHTAGVISCSTNSFEFPDKTDTRSTKECDKIAAIAKRRRDYFHRERRANAARVFRNGNALYARS